jgi:hypothetical protein
VQAVNADREPAPFGVGFHPYLMLGTASVDGLTLTVPANTCLEPASPAGGPVMAHRTNDLPAGCIPHWRSGPGDADAAARWTEQIGEGVGGLGQVTRAGRNGLNPSAIRPPANRTASDQVEDSVE